MVTIVGSWSKTLRNIFNPDFKSHVLHFWQNSSCKSHCMQAKCHWFLKQCWLIRSYDHNLGCCQDGSKQINYFAGVRIRKKKTNLRRRFVFWWWNKNVFFLTSYVVFVKCAEFHYIIWVPRRGLGSWTEAGRWSTVSQAAAHGSEPPPPPPCSCSTVESGSQLKSIVTLSN